MRDAKVQDTSMPTQSGVLGTVENLVGKATACEGMEKEGEARKATGGIEGAEWYRLERRLRT
jgi:uncharacterized protein YjbJ (UPF0337 family)